MGKPQVLVSYAPEDENFKDKLVGDLKGIAALDAQSSSADKQAMQKKLAQSDWLLLVRTQNSINSETTRSLIDSALEQFAEQKMRGILAIAYEPSRPQEIPLPWSIIQTYDGQGENYKMALDRASHILGSSRTANRQIVQIRPPLTERQNRTSRTANPSRPPLGIFLLYFSISLAVVASIVVGVIIYTNHGTVTPKPPIAATATVNPLALYNTVLQGKRPSLDDPLATNSSSNWKESPTCQFQNGKYHVTASTAGQYTPCLAQKTTFKDFAYQVQMTIIKGNAGGLIFRSDKNISTFYRLSLDATPGKPSIRVCSNKGQAQCTADHKVDEGTGLTPTSWPGIDSQVANMARTNTLTVIVQRTTIYLYVNGMFIGQVDDATTTEGEIGLYAASTDQSTEVAFSNVKVWKLS